MENNAAVYAGRPSPTIPIRRISPADLRQALALGWDDFQEKPSHLALLGVLYPIIGFILARLAFDYSVLPLLFPLVAGFALIGPLAAIGFYELSRRRETGMEMSWEQALGVAKSRSKGALALIGLLLMVIFLAWLAAAYAIYARTVGDMEPASIADFARQVFTTPAGWTLIIVGNAVGFLFAALSFSVSVVSLPLILDRNVSAATAVSTSVRAVLANPGTMALWGLIVAGLLAAGMVPLFLGLAVVVPVLGHATWHLYRRVVGPD